MSKYCVESTGCTKGWLMDNNKSNVSNEISTWWLVCYLEQDLKPPHIQAIFSSFFLACRTCALGFKLVWRSHSISEICALVFFYENFISTKWKISIQLWLNSLLFYYDFNNCPHPLPTNWNTYLKPGLLTIYGALLKMLFNSDSLSCHL